MSPDITDDRVLAAAVLTAVRDICRVVSGPVADERHDAIDETRTHDLAALARGFHRPAMLVDQLEIAVRRPDVVIRRVLTLGPEHQLLGMAVPGEHPLPEHALHQL